MTSADRTATLEEQADQFAVELTETLVGSLPGAPPAIAEVSEAARVLVRSKDDVPLLVRGAQLGTLAIRMRCELDSRGTWLAIESSAFHLIATVDRTPVLRFEYVRKPHSAPSAHVQIHAHRGALAHLSSQAEHPKPHDMSALHIPVGGSRFRPCIEDVIQFLIADCRFDGVEGWEETLNRGRERWRRTSGPRRCTRLPDRGSRNPGRAGL